MRGLLALMLTTVASWSGAAEPNEAEKLFRDIEKKLVTAKTLQIHFDLIVSMNDKKEKLTGTFLLGEGDKFRIEAEGDVFGKALKSICVCDGTNMVLETSAMKSQKTDKASKGIGTFLRGSLPQQGFFVSMLQIQGFSDDKSIKKSMTDFKLVGKEKVGTKDTQMIEWSVRENDKETALMKLWLDTKTSLPVKQVWKDTHLKDDITETYSEFIINPKIDTKKFELPKE